MVEPRPAMPTGPRPMNAPPAAPMATPDPKPWDFFRFLIVLGEVCVLLGVVAFLAPDNWDQLTSDALFLILLLLGLAGGILVVALAKPWTYLAAGIVVSLFPLVAMAFFALSILMDPLSGQGFVGAAFMLLALLVALPAGIRGFQHLRKARPAPAMRAGWRTGHGLFVTCVVFLLLGAVYSATMASRSATAGGVGGAVDFDIADVGGSRVNLTTEDIAFHPAEFGIAVNKATQIHIENKDSETHTFTYEVDGKENSHKLLPDSTIDIYVLFKQAGTVKFRCLPHSSDYDEGMVGKITVS